MTAAGCSGAAAADPTAVKTGRAVVTGGAGFARLATCAIASWPKVGPSSVWIRS